MKTEKKDEEKVQKTEKKIGIYDAKLLVYNLE